MPKALKRYVSVHTSIFQHDIHKNALKSQYYYPDLKELHTAPFTYSLCTVHTIIE